MKSYTEDEEFIKLIGQIICNSDKLNKILTVDEKDRLEKRIAELNQQFMLYRIQIDRIRIRETPHHKSVLDFLRQDWGYGPLDMDKFWEEYLQDILCYQEENELLDRGEFIRNYYKLIPPYVKVGSKIPEGIRNIYHESRWCFVYGQYSAAVAMCRTIIEAVLKAKYSLMGDLSEIIEIAKQRGLIDKNTAWNANKVRLFANKILHKAEPATETMAKDAIDHTLVFMEEIYFS